MPISVARHQERSVEEWRGGVERDCSAGCCLSPAWLGFYSQQSLVVLRLPVACGNRWQRRCLSTGTRRSGKQMAKKRSLCPGNVTRAHKLPKRWETPELQALETTCPPWVCPRVVPFSCSVPHNHQHSQCYLLHCWDPALEIQQHLLCQPLLLQRHYRAAVETSRWKTQATFCFH